MFRLAPAFGALRRVSASASASARAVSASASARAAGAAASARAALASASPFRALHNGGGRAEVGADRVVRAADAAPAPAPRAPFAAYLLSHVERHAAALGARAPCLVDAGDAARDVELGELPLRVGAAARGLRARGARRGGCVALHMTNSPDFVVAFLAASAIGAIVTTSNPAYTAPELAHQLRDSGAELVVTGPALGAVTAAAAAAAGLAPARVLVLGEPGARFLSEDDGARRAPEVEDVGDLAEALLVLPYSSGTTGAPKGVRLSHLSIMSNIEQCEAVPFGPPGDAVLGLLPFYHIYGMTVIMGAGLRFGQRIVTLPRFEPASFLDAVVRHRVSALPLVPPLIGFLAKHPLAAKSDLRHVRAVMNGAAPLDDQTQLACEKALGGARVRQGYGLTETGPITNLAPFGFAERGVAAGRGGAAPAKAGSIGPPVAGTEMRVADVSTPEAAAAAGSAAPRLLPAGAANVGEVQVRGPQVFLGYHGNAAASAEALISGGWFRTGDLGFYDEDGHFTIVDRLKELIKVKGLQVAPAEVEGALMVHELVYDAAVVPRPDARAGELPVAFVVPRAALLRSLGRAEEAAALPPLTQEALRAFLGARLAEYKVPVEVRFVEAGEIPKTASGKILRRVLRDKLRAEAADLKSA